MARMANVLRLLAYIVIAGALGWFVPNLFGLEPSGKGWMLGNFFYLWKVITALAGVVAGAVTGVALWQ
jgi:hypothetical protein